MPLALLVALFIGVPIAELYLILEVGGVIGTPLTVLVLIVDSVLGSLLLRSQGRSAWLRFARATRQGRLPGREVVDGALVIMGGALLITPGFLSDAVGLLLLLPPTRAVSRRLLVHRLGRRLVFGATAGESRRWARSPRPYDVEGTATEREAPAERERSSPRLER